MKRLSSAAIREQFLHFFEERGHARVPSSSLIPGNDPTLLFTNSGMVQFKDTFLGLEQRPYTRATTVQKCLRVSGKHNDLEEVGPSPRHHTFFEMLGNFSFGDYFKSEAIPMAWELLTKVFELPIERLWFTVFEGDDEVPPDDEAAQLWIAAGADPDRVLRFGRKDNFWVMADTGPCGPCSEITIYVGDDLRTMSAQGVNSDDPDYVEIWNNVFMQFERSTMQPLHRPSVDTGMGLERMAMVLQGVHSTYETDLFVPLIERQLALLGADESTYRARVAPFRAVADHSRAVAFLIADGVLPGNTGRSYVLRRILRRAVYQGRTVGFEKPFLAEIVAAVIEQMEAVYPELRERADFILETVDLEERRFLRTLWGGMNILNSVIERARAGGSTVISGDDAFILKDTYGFPPDLTQKIAAEYGLTVDEAGYERRMEEQRDRGRRAAQFKRAAEAEVWAGIDLPPTRFTGYVSVSGSGTVQAMVVASDQVAEAVAGQQVQIVLDSTPFYAESGGQVGDTGMLIGPHGRIRVEDVQRPVPGVIVHYGVVESGSVMLHDPVDARVDSARRAAVMRNHTATHLLHRALRDVLGEHAAQAGSLVAPDRLRFDFTHSRPLTAEQLREIERRVNAWIRADTPVVWQELSYQAAIDAGAIALFGEKYGDVVRMVTIGCVNGQDAPSTAALAERELAGFPMCSRELCGGTHVGRSGEIGLFRIISESSVAAGVRRIEALTGPEAEAWVDAQIATLQTIATRVGAPQTQLVERIEALITELKQHQRTLDEITARMVRADLEGLLTRVQSVGDIRFLAAQVEAPNAARLREMGDWLRDKLGSGVVVLATVFDGKAQILAMATPDLAGKRIHAGNLVKAIAPIVGGSGGGRPDMAQAGGRDSANIPQALERVAAVIAAQAGV